MYVSVHDAVNPHMLLLVSTVHLLAHVVHSSLVFAQGPCKVEIETMVWDLPIKLFPTFPSHTAPHSNMPAFLRHERIYH